jgi:surfeit locus 1 family protein
MYFSFKPRWTTTVVVAILMAMLISLGFWQLHRFDEKHLLEAKFAAGEKMAPIRLPQAQDLSHINYEAVQLEGHFDNAHSFLLDNQFYNHQVGYQVITPFLAENNSQWVLINRGWVATGNNRKILPKIPFVLGKVYLKGFLYRPKKNPFISNQLEPAAWPQRVQHLDAPMLAHYLHRPLYPWLILLDPKNPYGFIRNWQPTTMKATMHMGYAVQWFSMAIVLFIIYLGIHLKRKN